MAEVFAEISVPSNNCRQLMHLYRELLEILQQTLRTAGALWFVVVVKLKCQLIFSRSLTISDARAGPEVLLRNVANILQARGHAAHRQCRSRPNCSCNNDSCRLKHMRRPQSRCRDGEWCRRALEARASGITV